MFAQKNGKLGSKCKSVAIYIYTYGGGQRSYNHVDNMLKSLGRRYVDNRLK